MLLCHNTLNSTMWSYVQVLWSVPSLIKSDFKALLLHFLLHSWISLVWFCASILNYLNWLSLEQWHQAQYQKKWSRTGLDTSFTAYSHTSLPDPYTFRAWPFHFLCIPFIQLFFQQICTSYVLGTLLFAGDIAVHITNMLPPFETYVLVRKCGIKQLIMWWIF